MKSFKLTRRLDRTKIRIIDTICNLPHPSIPKKVIFNFDPTKGWAEIIWSATEYGIKFHKLF